MADTDTTIPESIDQHPDFPEFFRQAQQEMWGTFGPRIEQATANGNQGAVERLMAELDRQARQRAVVATRAMLNFQGGQGGAPFDRPFTRRGADTPTLSGVENQPEAPSTTPPPMAPPTSTLTGAPVNTSGLPPLDTTRPTVSGEVSYPGRLAQSPWASLRAFGAGLMTPLGVREGPAYESVEPVVTPTLSGTETAPLQTLVQGPDLGAVAEEDPMAAEIGRTLGFGPMFRAAGAIAQSAPVRWAGQQFARPAVGIPAALGASLFASTGEAQAPTTLDQAASTRAQIAKLQEQQQTLNDEISALGTVPDPQDPQRRITFQQRFGNIGPNSPPEEIRALQEFLASPQGYSLYSVDQNGRPVRPDGRWFARQGQVSGTQLALQAYLERLRTERATREASLNRIAEQLGPLQARLGRLDANAASDVSEANMSPLHRFVRDWVPPIAGIAGSLFGGAGTRAGMRYLGDRASRKIAAEADASLARAGGDAGARVGAINQYFTRGGGEAPFSIVPGAPAGFVPLGGQSAMDLYQPGSTWMRGGDWGRMAGFAGIGALGAGRYFGVDRADVEAARKRYNDNPTQDNANALRRAEYLAAASQSSMAFGLSAAMSYPAASAFMRYRSPRPDLGRAEQEVMSLNALARPQPRPISDAEVLSRRSDRNFSISPGTPRIPGEVERWVSPEGNNIIYRDPNTGHWMRQIRGGRPHRFPDGPPRTYRMISAVEGDSSSAVG